MMGWLAVIQYVLLLYLAYLFLMDPLWTYAALFGAAWFSIDIVKLLFVPLVVRQTPVNAGQEEPTTTK